VEFLRASASACSGLYRPFRTLSSSVSGNIIAYSTHVGSAWFSMILQSWSASFFGLATRYGLSCSSLAPNDFRHAPEQCYTALNASRRGRPFQIRLSENNSRRSIVSSPDSHHHPVFVSTSRPVTPRYITILKLVSPVVLVVDVELVTATGVFECCTFVLLSLLIVAIFLGRLSSIMSARGSLHLNDPFASRRKC
jgi:hypothetical protein